MPCLLASCKLGVLLLISLLVMVHSLASNVTINNPSNFNSSKIPTSGFTDEKNSSVPITAGQTEPATSLLVGSCLFQRFRENIRSVVNFRSVFPYVYIAIILFNLIFDPFLIIWVLISPIVFNIVRSTTTCYIFPVSLTSSTVCVLDHMTGFLLKYWFI